MPAQSHLILGGRRSGKSAYGEALAHKGPKPLTYVATSRAYDADHAARIQAHVDRRVGQGWTVIEVPDPTHLQEQLEICAAKPGTTLIDCLSMWLNNLFLDDRPVPDLTIPRGPGQLIFISAEVGQGLHPDSALGRAYADALGLLNQSIAAQVDTACLVTAGLPLKLKG